jgi:3-hydroxyacyl-CoA dehydrogenase/enoyl-CoA hydratase/3-hydroxybutyryl-CoA epimerase
LRGLFETRQIQPCDITEKLFKAGFQGKKNRNGFYDYAPAKNRGKRKRINKEIYKELGKIKRKKFDWEEIQTRLSMAMINEAAYCLQEGILNQPRDGDMGAVLGLGFPPFLGGPFRYMDSTGVKNILSTLKELNDKHGPRFTPAQILSDFVKKDMKFYTD